MTSSGRDSPINSNLEAENDHFRISDSIISWIENCKSLRDQNPETSLTNLLPPQIQPLIDDHQLSAPVVAWNLVRIFRMKKLKHLVDIRMQLYYLKIYISTCAQCEQLNKEFAALTNKHMLQGDVHAYTLNSLVDVKNGKLYEYLNELVNRSINHIANCDRCRAKGHYCQLCGPSSLISSKILSSTASNASINNSDASISFSGSNNSNNHNTNTGQTSVINTSNRSSIQQPDSTQASISNNMNSLTTSMKLTSLANTNLNQSSTMPPPHSQASASSCSIASMRSAVNDHELIFPFEIGRVAQCHACGCCFHLQCFIDAGQNCPKCERIQRRKAGEGESSQQHDSNDRGTQITEATTPLPNTTEDQQHQRQRQTALSDVGGLRMNPSNDQTGIAANESTMPSCRDS